MFQILYILALAIQLSIQSYPNYRIIEGESIKIEKIPYIVSIQSYDVNCHYCGGSIISPKWIVSAAHCTQDEKRDYYIRVGSTFSSKGGKIYNISRVVNHPNWDSTTINSDISLLELEEPITNKNLIFKSIKLPEAEKELRDGTRVRVSGWGKTIDKPNFKSSEILKSAELKMFNTEKCQERYSTKNMNLTATMICASVETGGPCQMDSGGPLVYNENELVGIVSWSLGCANPFYPSVYTKVSHFRNWIKMHTTI